MNASIQLNRLPRHSSWTICLGHASRIGRETALAALLLLGSSLSAAAPPNIIFVLSDDQRYDSLGVMGNPIIKTPALDMLASQGILFQNGYVTTSICCVSRASILTGQYESRHKINNFTKSFTKAQVDETYPLLLKKAGYKIGFAGKYGVGKKQPAKAFDFWECTKKSQPDYLTTDSTGLVVHDTDKVTSSAFKFLDMYAAQGPFCLSLSYKAPHEQDGHPPHFIPQARFDSLYQDVTIPTPVTADPKYWNSFPDFFRTDENIARIRWQYLFSTPELYQENVKKYYRLISGVDDAVGRLMAHVRKLGIEKNTVLIYMGDNGFMLGEHGLEGKWFGYEESIRVPMFIYYPGLPDELKQTRPRQIALNIDIAPTILSFAGVAPPPQMQGIDLVKMLEKKIPARQDFFYEHTFLKSPQLPRVEGVVMENLKYMKFIEHDSEELYDTAFDPHETTNLATDPAHAKDMDAMRSRYAQLKQQVK